jgi:CubicO group peptidase (beta-lactamase class C family)
MVTAVVASTGIAVASADEVAPRASAVLDRAVREAEVAGAVLLVADAQGIRFRRAAGVMDVESNRPARVDDLYWVASMTKPVTAVAIMMLAEEGKLSIDDPLAKHLPEFASMWLVADRTDDRMTLERPKTTITLRHLLTHTSGLADVPVPHEGTPLVQWVSESARQPLASEPGTKWAYSNTGINALGQSFETFVDERIFAPLGMKETTFHPSGAQLARVAKSYAIDPDQRAFTPTQHPLINGPVGSSRRVVAPAGGLYSTADDMCRFYQMMLRGGEYDGKRLLRESSVRELTRTQTGELETGFVEGMSFGLGFAVVKDPQGRTDMLSAGTFGHGGAYGTHSWADPKRGLIIIVMTQRSNFTPHADGASFREVIFRAVTEDFAR